MARKQDALNYHRRGRHGKLEVVPTKPLVSQLDLSLAYTPGVAEPCREIAEDESAAWDYTARGNLVAVISNGTAVLGLGDIGPAAGKPVMEGKACLFKKFADIDVFDLEVAETDIDRFVDIVAALEPTFGGINLEDIAAPGCFEIEKKLRERLKIPVFHDDQHGTAIISGAAMLNACELAGKKPADIKLVVSGAGAAAIACVDFFIALGLQKDNVVLVDSRGVIYEGRGNMNEHKQRFAIPDNGVRTLADAMKGSDMFLGVSIGGLVSQDMVRSMNERPIIFALANPDPEISYPDAVAARPDALVATGRSDYPNQVNNVLGFPYIFRGALDVRATTISEAMKVAAAEALAELTREPVPETVVTAYGGRHFKFGPDYMIPKPFDPRVLWWVAPAVAKSAVESGVARVGIDTEAYREQLILRTGNSGYSLMRNIIRAAKRDPKRIVFTDADDARLLRAIQKIVDEGIAKPILLGRRTKIEQICQEADLDLLERGAEIIDPRDSPHRETYAQAMWELRQRKGMSLQQARHSVSKDQRFGMMMLESGHADGLVSGLDLSVAETLRPALQILGVREGVKRATSMYMMLFKDRVRFFSDASINIDPDAATLADGTIQIVDAVTTMGIEPRVAMIGFSNFGAVNHPQVSKVTEALAMVRESRPELEIDGEMQIDFALDPVKMKEHFPFSTLSQSANVLIFPSLTASNVAFRVARSLGGAQAVGPILLGIAKPVALLQHESTEDDIVHQTAFAVITAQLQERREASAASAATDES